MTAPTLETRRRAAVRKALARGQALNSDASSEQFAAFHSRKKFPTLEELRTAAAQFGAPMLAGWAPVDRRGEPRIRPGWVEGPIARLGISPGSISIRRRNYARAQKSAEAAQRRHEKETQELARWWADNGAFPVRTVPQKQVTHFSKKSRANMSEAFHQLDYNVLLGNSGAPAVVTLTYPGDWQTVAPTGHALRRHLAAFRRAYERAWKQPLVALWKKEFQRRGAPHVHLLMVPPRGRAKAGRHEGKKFPQWLSHVWASIVAHPDPDEYDRHVKAGTGVDYPAALRGHDPKRAAVYFTKHGLFSAKDYQHDVPPEWHGPGDGPGRFWGYWRTQRIVVGVELTEAAAIAAARILRKHARAQGKPRTARGDVAAFPAEWPATYREGHTRKHRPGCRRKVDKQIRGKTVRVREACKCAKAEAPGAPVGARRVWRTPGGLLVPRDWEVAGLAGAQEYYEQAPSKRANVRRRILRMRGGAGWVAQNNGAISAALLARALALRPPPGTVARWSPSLARWCWP